MKALSASGSTKAVEMVAPLLLSHRVVKRSPWEAADVARILAAVMAAERGVIANHTQASPCSAQMGNEGGHPPTLQASTAELAQQILMCLSTQVGRGLIIVFLILTYVLALTSASELAGCTPTHLGGLFHPPPHCPGPAIRQNLASS